MAKKIFITGHRNLENEISVRKDIEFSLKYFRKKYGQIEAISSMAEGADLIFAEIAVANEIPLEAVFPFEKEEFKKDFTIEDDSKINDWQRVEAVLKNTYTTEVKPYCPIPKNKEERDKAYLDTGIAMVEKTDIILAVWDGYESKGKGGTADIVDFVKQHPNKELHIIPAKRKNKNDEAHRIDKDLEIFNSLDKEAIEIKNSFEGSWIMGITMGVITILCFTLKWLFFDNEKQILWYNILSVGEVISLLFSFIFLNYKANRRKDEFLTLRRDAEYLRSVLWFRNAGIPVPDAETKGYKPSDSILEIENNIRCNSKGKGNGYSKNAERMIWVLAEKQIAYQTEKRRPRNEKKS